MLEIDVFRETYRNTTESFTLNPHLWDNFDLSILPVVNTNWQEVKFLDASLSKNPQMSTLPQNSGGIYLFIAKPNILPETHLYLMYIGRAQLTETQNLRKRCSEYISEDRPKIRRMVETWGKYLYIRYLPLNNNDLIRKVEAELINKILPPFNDAVPDQKISAAIKAFD